MPVSSQHTQVCIEADRVIKQGARFSSAKTIDIVHFCFNAMAALVGCEIFAGRSGAIDGLGIDGDDNHTLRAL